MFWRKKNESLDVWACLGVNPLDMPRTPYGRVRENTLNSPPCPITSLSRHHLYIIHLINGLFLSYYNVTQMAISAKKWCKAIIYYYYYYLSLKIYCFFLGPYSATTDDFPVEYKHSRQTRCSTKIHVWFTVSFCQIFTGINHSLEFLSYFLIVSCYWPVFFNGWWHHSYW